MFNNLIITLALLITLSPFLGFPSSFKNPFYFLSGLAIAYLVFRHKRLKKKSTGFRRVYRKPKNAIELEVKGGAGAPEASIQPVSTLVEPDEEEK